LASQFELIDGTLAAVNSTKFRIQKPKKNTFNSNRIERHIAYINARIEECNFALAKEVWDSEKGKIITKNQKYNTQKHKY
jgi:hypothetical protein